MKTRAVFVGLSLLMFIFYSVGLTRAAVGPKHNYNIHFFPPPNEHPWQDSGSPPFDDDDNIIGPNAFSSPFIVIGPVEIIIIRPFGAEPMPNENQRVSHQPNGEVPR